MFKVFATFFKSNPKKGQITHPALQRDKDPNERWRIIGELGDGAFGKVFKAQAIDGDLISALKQVPIDYDEDLKDAIVEIDILTTSKHRNVLQLHEAFLFDSKLWMYIEFCNGGALDSVMQTLQQSLTEPQIKFVGHEVCQGLEYLHSQFVIHRDLKAANILLTTDGGIKLADFGVSAKDNNALTKHTTHIGTPFWMAPEVAVCEAIRDTPYNSPADIWSYGITLIELAQIEPPNHEMHASRVLIKIQKADPPTLARPRLWSSEFSDFLTKCLVKLPSGRLTASELLKHPFIATSSDPRPVKELLLEAFADVIIEDLPEDEAPEGIDYEESSQRSPSLASVTTGMGDDQVHTGSTEQLDDTVVPVPKVTEPPIVVEPPAQVPAPKKSVAPKPPAPSIPNGSVPSVKPVEEPVYIVPEAEVEPVPAPPTSPTSEAPKKDPPPTAPKPRHTSITTPEAPLSPAPIVQPVGDKEVLSENIISFLLMDLLDIVILDEYVEPSIKGVVYATMQEYVDQAQYADTVPSPGPPILPKVSPERTPGPEHSSSPSPPLPLLIHHSPYSPESESSDGMYSNCKIETDDAIYRNPAEDAPPPLPPKKSPPHSGPASSYINSGPTTPSDEPSLETSGSPPRGNVLYRTVRREYKDPEGRRVTKVHTKAIVRGHEQTATQRRYQSRKQNFREMRLLQKQENAEFQDLTAKFHVDREAHERKCETEREGVAKHYDSQLEQINKNQRQQIEQAEKAQSSDLRTLLKKLRAESEKDYKNFKGDARQELKAVEHEVSHLPREEKRETLRLRQTHKKLEIEGREQNFQRQQTLKMQDTVNTKREHHKEVLARLEERFLRSKHDVYRMRATDLWKLENQHKKQSDEMEMAQMKQLFALRRRQMLKQQEAELKQTNVSNEARWTELNAQQLIEKKRLPRQLKEEYKSRLQMYKQYMRAAAASNYEAEKDRLRQFEEDEKSRERERHAHLEKRHAKQRARLDKANATALAELKLVHQERKTLLSEHEVSKHEEMKVLQSQAEDKWQTDLYERQCQLEATFSNQVETLRRTGRSGPVLPPGHVVEAVGQPAFH